MIRLKVFLRLFVAVTLLAAAVLTFAYPFSVGMLWLLGADPTRFALSMAALFAVASVVNGLLMATMLLDRFVEKAEAEADAVELVRRALVLVEANNGSEKREEWIAAARQLLERRQS